MTEPNISLVNNGAMTTFPAQSGVTMSYMLYADDSVFANWTDWVNDSASSPNAQQRSNASTYSDYVLKLKCVLALVDNACGLVHATHGALFISSPSTGEVVATNPTTTVESNTYTFTNTLYGAWKETANGSKLTMPNSAAASGATAITNSSIADPFF